MYPVIAKLGAGEGESRKQARSFALSPQARWFGERFRRFDQGLFLKVNRLRGQMEEGSRPIQLIWPFFIVLTLISLFNVV